MKKIIYLSFMALLFTISSHTAHAALVGSLHVGSKGGEVSEMQQFLATNSRIYPAGTVDGSFGPNTKFAVGQFQVSYDLVQDGYAGVNTIAKMNSVMASGLGLDLTVPSMSDVTVQTNNNAATIGWTTMEAARGQVFYSTSPIQANEEEMHGQLPYIGGSVAVNTDAAQTSQSVTIQNLQPHTLYYYINRAIDNSGNVSMNLQKTFQTN